MNHTSEFIRIVCVVGGLFAFAFLGGVWHDWRRGVEHPFKNTWLRIKKDVREPSGPDSLDYD